MPVLLAAQGIPLASLGGRVKAQDGTPLSGVRVTVRSVSLQGQREAQTMVTGEYFLPFLPPGEYAVRFTLPGMQDVDKGVALNAAVEARLDVELEPARAQESVTVSADAVAGTPLDTTQVVSSYKQKLVDQLPLDRSLRSVSLLAPGVTDNGPTGNIGSANTRPALVISGAQSFESLFLVDGAVVNENLRGQPQDLYIEDAIQETTVLRGSISAEYGRFTGGVVNAITKSGGNLFHGSFRTAFTNDDWTTLDPYQEANGLARVDQLDESYEATLGGLLWKDRIWFFAAGRQQKLDDAQHTVVPAGQPDAVPIPFVHTVDENRVEGKLTANVTPQHNLVASYVRVDGSETNSLYLPPGDLGVLNDLEYPHSLLALSYNGILSEKLFVEAQYSQRRFSIDGSGSAYTDFVRGTRVDDFNDGVTYNTPAGYSGHPQSYDDTSWLAKVSYLRPTEHLGTHDLRAGYEWFQKQTLANYDFSGSGFVLNLFDDPIVRGAGVYPVLRPRNVSQPANAFLQWRPILQLSTGTDFVTQSAFVNDRIQWGAHWSFNLGLRYDRNDSRSGGGQVVSTSSAWSPRLAAQFDPTGEGRIILNAGYAKYVAGLHEGVVQIYQGAGITSYLNWAYNGPCINCDPNAPTDQLVPMDRALAMVDAWFQGMGGTNRAPDLGGRLAGSNRIAPTDTLRSPSAKEFSFGAGAALGSRGWVRADFLYRNYDDFYDGRLDLTTGQVTSPWGTQLDVEVLENSPTLDRRYEAVQTQIQYQFSTAMFGGASYTWSRLTGNVVGENEFVSAATDQAGEYPEYAQPRWNNPTGYLPGDQRHRARIWLGANVPVGLTQLGFTVLQSYASGLPYEATGTVDVSMVSNPGYANPPDGATYYFSPRGAFRTDAISSTDIAATLTVRVFQTVDLFIQPQVLNLFNQHGVVAVRTDEVDTNPDKFAKFDPFTEKPVRGVNYQYAEGFGQPLAYQLPRTFRISVGLRF